MGAATKIFFSVRKKIICSWPNAATWPRAAKQSQNTLQHPFRDSNMADAAWKMFKDKVTAKRGKKHDAGDTTTGSPSSLNEPHKEHNMASNYKGLYGIFYKISTKVVKSENIQ